MSGFEYSLSFYDGFNHLPLFDARFRPVPPRIEVVQVFPRIRMYGGDAAWPLRWFTLKGEAGYFTSRDPAGGRVRPLRHPGGAPGGRVVPRRRLRRRGRDDEAARPRTSPPTAGLTQSFLGRASYTIDVNRSVASSRASSARTAAASGSKGSTRRRMGQHLRTTIRFDLIRGRDDDFLGQYRRNSHLTATLRYSF